MSAATIYAALLVMILCLIGGCALRTSEAYRIEDVEREAPVKRALLAERTPGNHVRAALRIPRAR